MEKKLYNITTYLFLKVFILKQFLSMAHMKTWWKSYNKNQILNVFLLSLAIKSTKTKK